MGLQIGCWLLGGFILMGVGAAEAAQVGSGVTGRVQFTLPKPERSRRGRSRAPEQAKPGEVVLVLRDGETLIEVAVGKDGLFAATLPEGDYSLEYFRYGDRTEFVQPHLIAVTDARMHCIGTLTFDFDGLAAIGANERNRTTVDGDCEALRAPLAALAGVTAAEMIAKPAVERPPFAAPLDVGAFFRAMMWGWTGNARGRGIAGHGPQAIYRIGLVNPAFDENGPQLELSFTYNIERFDTSRPGSPKIAPIAEVGAGIGYHAWFVDAWVNVGWGIPGEVAIVAGLDLTVPVVRLGMRGGVTFGDGMPPQEIILVHLSLSPVGILGLLL